MAKYIYRGGWEVKNYHGNNLLNILRDCNLHFVYIHYYVNTIATFSTVGWGELNETLIFLETPFG